jgi:hypothetical protein
MAVFNMVSHRVESGSQQAGIPASVACHKTHLYRTSLVTQLASY